MKKNVKWFAAVLAALTLGYGAVSCGSDSKEPEWEWPDPDPDPDPDPEPQPGGCDCGGEIGAGILMLCVLALFGAAVLIKKKR